MAAPPPVPGRRGRLVIAVALGMTALLGLCGCANEATSDEPPPLGALPHVRAQGDLVLPLDHYLPKPRERAAIATAKSELTAQCMTRLGFADYPVDSYAAQAQVPLHGNDFGVFDETNARTYGFKASFGGPLLDQAADLEHRFDGWDSPEVTSALYGNAARPTSVGEARGGAVPSAVPSGGCSAEGARELYALVGASAPADVFWMDNLAAQAFGRAAADERLVPPTTAWSQCMKAAGYDYKTPSESNNDSPTDDADGAAVAGGKRTALADVHCKWSSGYIDTFAALDAAYEKQAIEVNAERLQDALDTRQRLLAAMAAHGLGRIRDVGEK